MMTEQWVTSYPRVSCRLRVSNRGYRLLAALGLLVATTSTAAISSASADEISRPQFHITPPSGWMNDPCGLYMGWKQTPAAQYGSLGDWTGGYQSLPVSLSLRDIPNAGLRMCYDPVKELESLRGKHFSFGPQTIGQGNTLLSGAGVQGDLLEIIATFQLDTATEFGFQLRKGQQGDCTVAYNTQSKTIFLTPSACGYATSQLLPTADGLVKFHIYLDRTIVDVFGNDGIIWNSEFFKADPSHIGLELYTTGGDVQLLSLDVWQLTAVPEPSAISVLGAGALCVAFVYGIRRRPRSRCGETTHTR